MRSLPFALIASLALSSCATDPAAQVGRAASGEPAAALPVVAAPAAVRMVDAPGLNVEDLTARVREAVARTSGLEVVDELSVRRELAACTEAPCPEEVAVRYRDARYLVATTVSRVGATFLSSVRVQEGATELARANAEDPDARRAVAKAGWAVGAVLRRVLMDSGAASPVVAPGEVQGAGVGTERGDDG